MRLRLVSLAIVIVAVVLAVMAWQRNTAQAPIAPAAPARAALAARGPVCAGSPSPLAPPAADPETRLSRIRTLAARARPLSPTANGGGEGSIFHQTSRSFSGCSAPSTGVTFR